MTTHAPLPPAVQEAVDFGRALPDVQVYFDDWRGIPGGDAIQVDHLFRIPGDSIELVTLWAADESGDWHMTYASWRTFSERTTSHPLATWPLVRDFIESRATPTERRPRCDAPEASTTTRS